jgi:hypothetical protein
MTQIQLIGDLEGYLDVGQETVFPLNFAIAEIRDLSQRKGNYSKTINLQGTKNNNLLLNHYFDANIVAGTFDVAKRTDCIVIQNGVVILDNCYLQLLRVTNLKGLVTYEVVIKDKTADFFQVINQLEMTDIDLTDANHQITASNVVASFSNSYTDIYKYGLSRANLNSYQLSNIIPHLYVRPLFDRIVQRAGYQYQFDEALFDKLLITKSGDPIQVSDIDPEIDRVVARRTSSVTTNFAQSSSGIQTSFSQQIIANTEIQDINGYYNPLSGVYDVPYNLTSPNELIAKVRVEYDLILDNTSGATAYLQSTIPLSSSRYKVQSIIKKNGTTTILTYNANNYDVAVGTGIASGATTVDTGVIEFELPLSSLLSTDDLRNYVGVNISTLLGGVNRWRTAVSGGTNVRVDVDVKVNRLEVSYTPNLTSVVSGATINVNSYLPKKMKQSDFVKSLFQMFNIYVENDKTNERLLILKTRDKYYDDGATKDWTYKFARDREHNIQFLPDVTAKRMVLTYKNDEEDYNKIYVQSTNEVYGQLEYTFESEFVRDTQRNEVIFAPTPVLVTPFGALAPAQSYPDSRVGVRIVYDGGLFDCGAFNVYDYSTVGETNLTEYPLLVHFNHPTTPTYDINFGTNDYYFFQPATLTNNNLYNLHWRRTFGQINRGKLLTGSFYLDTVDINTLKLSDKIQIGNTQWIINRISDYDANSTELTRVELISVDEESFFTPFQSRPFAQLIQVVPPQQNNNVQQRALVQGEYNVISEPSIVNGSDNNVQSSALVIGSNNYVPEGLENVVIIGNGVTASESNTMYVTNLIADSITGVGQTVLPIIQVSSNYTFTPDDYTAHVVVAGLLVRLPSTADVPDGKVYVVKNDGIKDTTVEANGSDTIDGSTTITLKKTNESVTLQSTGSDWIII